MSLDLEFSVVDRAFTHSSDSATATVREVLAFLAAKNKLHHAVTYVVNNRTQKLNKAYKKDIPIIASSTTQIKDSDSNLLEFNDFDGLVEESNSSEKNFIYGVFKTSDKRDAFSAHFKKHVSAKKRTDKTTSFSFWMDTPRGISSHTRVLEVPTWKEIQGNYATSCRTNLDWLMRQDGKDIAGKLIIWYGDPGFGKTFAIRALSKEWTSWCNFHYITDPANMFGRDSKYIVDLMYQLSEQAPSNAAQGWGDVPRPSDYRDIANYMEDMEESVEEANAAKKWNLVVIEDAGELITVDAKSNNSVALSKLLNMTDGLLGQGVKMMILITTNEDFEKLNKAAVRYGRCLSKVDFKPMTEAEVQAWLKSNKVDPSKYAGQKALADLYALKNDAHVAQLSTPTSTIGFTKAA